MSVLLSLKEHKQNVEELGLYDEERLRELYRKLLTFDRTVPVQYMFHDPVSIEPEETLLMIMSNMEEHTQIKGFRERSYIIIEDLIRNRGSDKELSNKPYYLMHLIFLAEEIAKEGNLNPLQAFKPGLEAGEYKEITCDLVPDMEGLIRQMIDEYVGHS